jgi:hypothetical protein
MKITETTLKTLKNLITPLVCLIVSLVLYFVFISPYNSYKSTFENLKSDYERSISNLNSNLVVLKKASENKEKLEKLSPALKSLVPDTANASDLVGLIDKEANNFRFRSVDENRNITSNENDAKKLIEVRFNGRSPGMASSINFLKKLATNNEKLIKITRLELTNIPEELFTRVSFNAFSIYSSTAPKTNIEDPLLNVFEDSKFNSLVSSF